MSARLQGNSWTHALLLYKGDEIMIKEENIWMGYVETHYFDEFKGLAMKQSDFLSQFPYALITRVDGGGMPWLHSAFHIYTESIKNPVTGKLVDSGILLSGEMFSILAKSSDFLSGFDEVWLSYSEPIASLPAGLDFTSGFPITDMRNPNQIASVIQWMNASGCVLGFGDGVGLNYATTDENIADLLDEYGIRDPEEGEPHKLRLILP